MHRTVRAAIATPSLVTSARVGQVEAQVPTIALKPGLVITKSGRVVRDVYRIVAPKSSDSAVVTIRGSNITVDFAGATLDGAPVGSEPDAGAGVAIRID